MRQEAIKEFRKTWKPKEPQRERRASRPSLALTPKVEEVAPRASLAHPLPPPAPAALCARGEMLAEGPPTGVRRRPLREDGELETLSRVAKDRRDTRAPRTHRAPPPLPPSTQAMLLRLERNAKTRKSNKQQHASELTDSSVRVLASYSVPPMAVLDAGRDAFVPVQAEWLEVVQESVPAETSPADTAASDEAFSKERKRTSRPVWRALRYALAGSVFCAAFGWKIDEGQIREHASAWTHTTISAITTTWARIVDVKSVPAPSARLGAESPSTPLLCEEQAPGANVLATMCEVPEESAAMQSVLNDEARPLMSEADGVAELMLTPASEELATAREDLTPSVKRHRPRHRRSHDAAIKRSVRATAAR